MKVRILITLLACTVVTACKKSDDKTNPDKDPAATSYTPSTEIYADQPVMYTNNGIVTDQSLIKAFLTRRGNVERFTFDTPGSTVIGSYTVELSDAGALIGPAKRATYEVMTDSLLVLVDSEKKTPDNKAGVTDTIGNLVNAYGPVAKCPDFYKLACPYSERFVLQLKGGKMYVPYVISLVTVTYDKHVLGVQVPFTQAGFYSAGTAGLVNQTALLDKLAGYETITYQDATSGQAVTTNRYDTTVVQVLKRELIKQ